MANRPLRLTTPDSTGAAFSVCETTPGALSDWIARLPMAVTSEAAHQLLRITSEVVRLGIDPDARFNYLELVRAPAHYICTRLDRNAVVDRRAAKVTHNSRSRCRTNWRRVTRSSCATRCSKTTLRVRCGILSVMPVIAHSRVCRLRCAGRTSSTPMRRTRAWYEINQLFALAEELGIGPSAYADDNAQPRRSSRSPTYICVSRCSRLPSPISCARRMCRPFITRSNTGPRA